MQNIRLPDISLKVPQEDETIALCINLWLDKNTFWNKVYLTYHIKCKRYRASNGTDKSATLKGKLQSPSPVHRSAV